VSPDAVVVPPFPDHEMTVDPAAQREPENPFDATVVLLEVPQRDGVDIPPPQLTTTALLLPPSLVPTKFPPILASAPVLDDAEMN